MRDRARRRAVRRVPHVPRVGAAARGAAQLGELRDQADRHPDEDVWRNFRLHPDLVLAEGWWLTRTGRPRSEPEIRVDQVRDLISEIAGAPFEARRRVFVIDDAHTMNEPAQNALLKSLEEPPPRSHVVLVTGSPLGLRQTIRSRCQLLRFGPLPRPTVAAALRENDGPRRGGGEPARRGGGRQPGRRAATLVREPTASCARRSWACSSAWTASTRSAAWRPPRRSSSRTTPRSCSRRCARSCGTWRRCARAPTATLVNPDLAARLAPLARGTLGTRALVLADDAAQARQALRGFASRLLTFDVLVDALAGD